MSNQDRIIGKHVYGNLYEVDAALADNESYLKKLVLKAVEKANATLIDIRSWNIEGERGGVSVIALVAESHIAVHTWREYRYATVDVYTCGERTDPWKAFDVILKGLSPKYYTVHYSDRSQLPRGYHS